ncbi:MotA/TolQ/ExbB proton channel family protein [Thiorhodococcus fuscus]|uniref:MotA/TolQ/ExbB proton channel family protein n=1 Tax=Thiorhodococcus fuscus TaxID=527200 RepID=A0ABW4Y4D2_9GAMM
MFFNPILESLLFESNAANVTEIFLWLTLIGFLLSAFLAFVGKGQRFVSETPTLLTSLGILGTFVGIVVGLMHFDPQNIDGSIANLLDGLKTAFITSLVGMGSAIFFKILITTPLLSSKREQEDISGAGPEDILRALLDQNSHFDQLRVAISGAEETSLVGQLKLLRTDQTDHHKESLRHLDDFRTAVSGTEETSLVGQFKLLRSDEHDRHKETMHAIKEDRDRLDNFAQKLWEELDEFAEMLSKSATEQMMNALKEVIADFNKNLTEQFGENFKALDASVQKLVQWQENYQAQLEQMSAQYAQAVEAITKTEASVAHISDESQQIPVAMEKLKAVLLVNQHQLSELKNHLEAFRDMRDKAVEAVPQIREQVEQTVKDVAASVQAASTHYTTLLDRSERYIQAHDEKTHAFLEKLVQTADEGIGKVKLGLESSANDVKAAISTSADALAKDVKSLLADTTSEVTKTVTVASDHYSKLLEKSDAYIQAHDKKSQELLDRFVTATGKGIEKVKEGLESSATAVKTAILTGAEEFDNSVQRLQGNLTSTSDQIAAQSEKIRQQLQDTFKEVNEHVRVMLATLSDESKSLSKTLKTTGEQVQRDTQETQKQVAESIKQMQSRLESSLNEVFEVQARSMSRAAEGLEDHMKKAILKTGEGVNTQLSAIDQAMQKEIDRVMMEMGRALAQIAGQFTQDYMKLVSAMQQVVEAQPRRIP